MFKVDRKIKIKRHIQKMIQQILDAFFVNTENASSCGSHLTAFSSRLDFNEKFSNEFAGRLY